MSVKITDLVDQEALDKLRELDGELAKVLETYKKVAQDIAKGLNINVSCIGDIDKLEQILAVKGREAAQVQQQLTNVVSQQQQVIANTTNTISRQLMEQERVNKTQRDAYAEYDRVKKLLEDFNGSYDEHLKKLVDLNTKLAKNKKEQQDVEKAFKQGSLSLAQYQSEQAKLIEQQRYLTQEKRTLTQIMTAEEKSMQTADASYVQLSQQLELLKKAYKDLSAESRDSDIGREMEQAIQNLDAHLKDVAADMGEFQRNVGNYAIAGQQGVVTTDSVIAAMNQQALTTQDLIDQTKILEEAKLMLNKEDANYQATLTAVNAKIDENKRKLTDVSDILGKQATTVAEAEAQNKRLSEAIKHIDLTSADAKQRLAELRAQIASNNETIAQASGNNEKFADSMLSLIGVNGNFGKSIMELESSGNFLQGMTTKVSAFGKTLLGLLANPWVLAFLGIAGVAAGFKWWYDYNKGLVEATKLTKDFTGLSGSELKAVRNEVQAVADSYDKDFREVLEAANAMSKQFGISVQESLKLMEDGFAAGADVNGEFLENIKEYPAYFKEAGISASEFIAITTQANQAGIYSDKGIDVIKEGNLRIREMTKATAEALDAIGISSKEAQKALADGSKTTFNIMQEVSEKLAEFPESSSEVGTALADIFGGPGEDAGLQYILTLKDIDTNLDNVKDRAGELGRLQNEQLKSQVELENAISSVFDATGGSFESMTTSAKIFINNGIVKIIKGCVDIVNWFIRLYNKSVIVRGAFNDIVLGFKNIWTIAKFVLNQLITSFKALGTIVEGVVTFDYDKIKQGWIDGFNSLKGNIETMIKEIASDTAEAFNKTISDEIQEVSIGIDADIEGVGAKEPGKKTGGGNVTTTTEADKKAAEEALKLLAELEESKISLMAEGHEKELAMIRLKYKKKLDEIKGNTETENALRIQLAEECEREISECERTYQVELSKINLANRLAIVKKGSKEELDLKLAQLEAERTAELETAEKTGADILLINEKFNKKRLEMEEEYAANSADITMNRYADMQTEADNAYLDQVNALKSRYIEEMRLAEGNAAEQAAIKARFEEYQAKLSEDYAIQTAQSSVAMLEEILKTENLSAEERKRYELELAKAKGDLEAAIADQAIAEIDRVNQADAEAKEKRLQNAQQWLQVASDSLNAINELVGTIYDAKIEKVEAEQEANQEAAEAEQERISELVEKKVITEEEGEARKRAAEAQTAKKNEELEKKKAKLKQQQAIWDKANSAAQCAIATALGIMQLWVNPGFPAAIPMAAVVGALGALQLATILATPLPKYAKGTKSHKGGPAMVGDGGEPELVTFGGKSWITPDTPTIVDLPAGAAVIPHINGVDESLVPIPTSTNDSKTPVIINNDYSRLEAKMDNFIYLIKQQTKQQRQIANDAALKRISDRL